MARRRIIGKPGSTLLRALLPLILAVPGPAHGQIDIEMPGVTDAVRNNVLAFLSLTRYAEREDLTPDTMSRLQRRIVSETRQALEPLGYYEPDVTYAVTQSGTRWKVTIDNKPMPRP